MSREALEKAVAVALGILGVVFLASLAALVLLCYRKMSRKRAHLFDSEEFRPEVQLISGKNGSELHWSEYELDDVRLAPIFRKILNDTQWVDDATGLIPHSLGILKLCHQITESHTVPALADQPKERMHQIVQFSRLVSPRIDDVAKAMYPPLDPRLLEARCTSLVLSIHMLAYMAHPSSPKESDMFIVESLRELYNHLLHLRNIAERHDDSHTVFREAQASQEIQK